MEKKILEIIKEFFKKQPVYHNYDNTEKRLKTKVSGYIITDNQRQKLIKKIKSLNLGGQN